VPDVLLSSGINRPASILALQSLVARNFRRLSVPEYPMNRQIRQQDIFLSIVIPAYNEGRRLPRTLRETIKYLSAQTLASEIIVITDGSTDDTIAVAESFSDEFPNLKVIAFKQNKGKGFAVKAGLQAATGKYRLFMDADYAVPIEYVDQFLEQANKGYEIVIASRALKDSKLSMQQSFARRSFGQAFGIIQKAVLGMPFVDTQCGFKLFSAHAVETIIPLVTYDCAYFDAELLYVAHRLKTNVQEVGVEWHHDQETRLPIGFRRSLDLLRKLMMIRSIHRLTNPQVANETNKRADLARL